MQGGAERGVLVGVDIGTSAVKVLGVTPHGRPVASASARYPLATPLPERVEQDADQVCDATLAALRDALAQVAQSGETIAALGFSSAMHGLLPVDAAGAPLGPFVTWLDRRAAGVARRWLADGTAAQLYERTGAPVHAMLPSCKLRWFREHDPDSVTRAAKFVSLKELVVFRLTGEWYVDWGIASATGLFDLFAHAWSEPALAAAGIAAAKLATPAPPSTLLQTRTQVAAGAGLRDGTRVALGSSDGALANLGVGAVGGDSVALTLGTSGALRTVVDRPVLDAHGRTFCYCSDDAKYIAGGPTSSAGAVLEKLFALLLADVAPENRFTRAVALAEAAEPGARGVTVLPFLSGERAPYWRADLRGAICGLDLTHTPGDIVRAAFESVVFAVASVYRVLSERIADHATLRLSGGLSGVPFVRQLVADIFARDAYAMDQPEASAFGAAMCAGIAIGALANDRAVAALLQPLAVHQPNREIAARYVDVFARYCDVAAANLPLYG